jgi:hypothetical protein
MPGGEVNPHTHAPHVIGFNAVRERGGGIEMKHAHAPGVEVV